MTITLRGAMGKAERLYSSRKNNREFLQTLYVKQLSFLSDAFERDFNEMLSKTSTDMEVLLEPEQGDLKVTFTLSEM
jgi:hypothetical protein